MTSATATSKGRVTIPVDVRNELGLSAGDRKGIIAKPGRPVQIEEMNAAIVEQVIAANAAAGIAE
jgi:AbrB family looped-hinge helix DNA binding protein